MPAQFSPAVGPTAHAARRLPDDVLSLAVAQRAIELHLAGLSQRAIARELRIARGSVQVILHGTWAGFRRHLAAPPPNQSPGRRRPAQRCPECGRLVKLPCLACGVEHTRAPRGQPDTPVSAADELRVALSGAELERYQRLRRAKQALAEATAHRAEGPPPPEAHPGGDQEQVLTCCARCLWPLTVRIGRQVTVYDRNTRRSVRRCPNCHRVLPKLTPEEIHRHLEH